MTSATQPRGIRISLREFFALVAAVAVACAALKYANEYWLAVVSLVTLVAYVAATIVALVDRGPRQVAAVGFLATMSIYAALLYARRPEGAANTLPRSHPEFDPYNGILPTTRLMRPLFEAMSANWYVDLATGKSLNESQLPSGATIVSYSGGGFAPGGVAAPTTGFTHVGEIPAREHFMPIAHCFWALLFGYIAAKFARWVYARRLREQDAVGLPANNA
jgi:hypothetical protein